MPIQLIKTMRPRQWIKNIFVFVAIVFDGRFSIESFDMIGRVFIAFVIFCIVSGVIYLMNDLNDVEEDRLHPKKRHRPIASGQLSPDIARMTMYILGISSLAASFWIDQIWGTSLFIIVSIYALLQLAYNLKLKQIVLLDVAAVASGFVLRVAAGVAMFDETRFSPWLYLCVGLLALFLVLGKRRHELLILGNQAREHRSILASYSIEFIDQLLTIVATSAIVSYCLYTFLAEGLPDGNLMMLTIPFAMYAIFRWLYLMNIEEKGGAPEDLVLEDRPLQINSALFVLIIIFVLYIA